MKHCVEITIRVGTDFQMCDNAMEALGTGLSILVQKALNEGLWRRQQSGLAKGDSGTPVTVWCARIARVPVNPSLGDK